MIRPNFLNGCLRSIILADGAANHHDTGGNRSLPIPGLELAIYTRAGRCSGPTISLAASTTPVREDARLALSTRQWLLWAAR
jgi:hypothetical protein